MARFTIAAAVAVLKLCSIVVASPTGASRPAGLHPSLQFDPSLAWDDSQIPNPQLLAAAPRELRLAPNASLIAPPSDLQGPSNVEKRVIGVDNRILLVSDDFPFRAVGKIIWANGVVCSGSLIGPRHVLTARHCIPQNGMGARFIPRYDNGAAPFGTGNLQVATWIDYGYAPNSQCEWKEDWSVWVIDQRLGDNLGYFGAKTWSAAELDRPIMFTSGYPGDRDNTQRPYHMNSISVKSATSFRCDAFGPIYNDADMAGGQSGSPLWEKDASNNRYVWGTLTVFSSTETVAGGGNFMVDTINRMRTEFP